MYNIKLQNHVPTPQPASSPFVVAAHYYAAWKKGAPGLHNGFDDLHPFPERTPLAGYYDEEDPNYCDWEIKWAVEHGINCFIHCWYRRNYNQGHPVTVNDLRCGHGLHEALFNAKYQQMMKFAIMFEASPKWGGTDPQDMLDNLMPFWMENYFKRGNYLVIDNKPVLFVYNQQRLSAEGFKNPADQKETFDRCREYCRQHGFDGMTFAVCDPAPDREKYEDEMARGFDFRFGYSTQWNPEQNYPQDDEIIAGQLSKVTENYALDPMRHIATASCFRDSEPRTTQHWIDMGYGFEHEKRWYLSPIGYRTVLKKMRALSETLPEGAWGRKILMIDNWNEWDEGHFVAPSVQFGFRYLQAIREAMTDCDNLPDYRMPQDLGLSNFNHTWDEPDLGEICKEKFHLDEK